MQTFMLVLENKNIAEVSISVGVQSKARTILDLTNTGTAG
jgi:hypothetical protein